MGSGLARAAFALCSIGAMQARAQDAPEWQAGHGSVSVDYQHLFMNGDWWDVGPKRPNGSVIVNSVDLGVDYFFADRWDIGLSLPFIQARYSGPLPHPLVTFPVAPAHTVYVDDGDWHGTWADWSSTLRYHATVASYELTPQLTLDIPSHAYTFYGSATVGQDLKKAGLGLEVGHQLELSNFFYTAHYEYYFVERTLGINVDYYDFGADLGYFFNPRLQLRGFVDAKLGNGQTDTQLGEHCPPCADEYWFEHDRFRLEDHVNVGGALDYTAADRYTFTTAVQRMVWGKSNLNLKYGLDFRLSIGF